MVSDPILVFTILMVVILLAPLVAERFKVPDLVLLLGVGAVLGPNGLGVLERDNAITLFGSVGLLYIMFIAGLEIDLHRFIRTRNRSIGFGMLTFSIPQLLGTLAGRYILGFDWTASVLLASLFASHTLLAYPIASRFGLSRSEPVAITVGGTIITDTLALMVLAVIADLSKGVEFGLFFWLNIVFGICGLIVITCLGVPLVTRWFFKKVTEHGGAQFIFVLAMVCGCSYLSHYAKMEPIIGAFLVGAAFNRLIPERSPLMNRVEFVGHNLFIPFFLISVGMLVDFKSLAGSGRAWLVLLTMVFTVIFSKYMAAWCARKIFGYSVEAGRMIFGLSVVQAAATLAAVLVGYELKIFDSTVLNGAIAMILVTCPLGAWYVERYGRKMAEQDMVRREAPCTEQRLLVALSRPESSMGLLNLSFMLRRPSMPGMICPLTVVSDTGDTDDAVAKGEKHLAHCMSQAASANIPVSPKVRVDLNTSDGIVHAAKELRSSMVIAGLGERGSFGSMLFGTVMDNLVSECPSRLLFCRLTQPPNTIRRIIVPFSQLSGDRLDLENLLEDMKSLSRQLGADLCVHVLNGEQELADKLNGIASVCPLTVVGAETWTQAQAEVLGGLGTDDLILLPCERRESPLWSPGMENLQQQLLTRHQERSVLLAYPPLMGAEILPVSEPEVAAGGGGGMSYHGVDIGAGVEMDKALEVMVSVGFSGVPGGVSAFRQLEASARLYPLDLCDGVVLLHCHNDDISKPMLLVGLGRGNDWRFHNLKGGYDTLLALLSPKGSAPEAHLNTLADLARRFMDKEVSGRLKAAGTAEEFCRLLKG